MTHPVFRHGNRVALMEIIGKPGHFGVAMDGGHFVVALPPGYDGRTEVRWIQGWIIVSHPDMPAILADTSTGKVGPMNEHALAAAMAMYAPPRPGMTLH